VSALEDEMWAVPVPGLGFCPLVIARAPRDGAEVDFSFAYLQPTLSEHPPTPDLIAPLEAWGSAWLGLVSTLPFRKGRWKRCGALPGFDRALWPVPPVRSSAVDEAEPIEQWGRYPWGEMWSIETTNDEPTMTLISNTPATREEALRFPRIDVVTAASLFEKALATYFKGRRPGFWDMKLSLNAISPESPRVWRDYADRVRSVPSSRPPSWLPAGRKTDRQLKPGAWMGLPLIGGGFGAAMLVAKPDRHLRFFSDAVVMGMRRRWDRWPTLEDVSKLTPEDGALVTQTSMICVRDGRWRVLGYHDKFDPNEWVWPRPWYQRSENGEDGPVVVPTGDEEKIEVNIDPAILRLDPHAGQRCGGSSGYGMIELDVPRIMDGTAPKLGGSLELHYGIVTPDRLAAWRRINGALEQAIASHAK
jgi:hypothetical protein